MPWQLIYTSAPRLLTAGQTGFGTVARHREIPALVVSAVERASQFARLPGMDAGRVVFTHRIVDAASARHHVLSRTASAGADYTGRTNHLAHHLILTAAEAAELTERGVSAADVMVRFPWRTAWTENARWLEDNETPALTMLPLDRQEHLSAWTEATGDPLHANHLVAGTGARSGCVVIAPARVEMLRLFAESLRGVPEQGWMFTFTTALDPGDSPGDFRWLGFTQGSPVLETLQAGRRFALDLTRPESLPVAEPLPEKPKAPTLLTPVTGKRSAPPRVSAPAGGAFVEPPAELPVPLVARMSGPMAAPPPPAFRRGENIGESAEDRGGVHGWRIVGSVVVGACAMLAALWWMFEGARSRMLQPPPDSADTSLRIPSDDFPAPVPSVGVPPAPPVVSKGTPSTAPSPSLPPQPAPEEDLIPWRAVHAAQLDTLDLPQLRIEQTHLLVTSNGETRGPLIEARSNLSLSPREPSPVIKVDYASHRAMWTASPDSAVVPPVQWRVLHDHREILRVLIGDGSQEKPLNATAVSAAQDHAGVVTGSFAEMVRRFGNQRLWLRLPGSAVTRFREFGYPGTSLLPLRDLKADISDLSAWLVQEEARAQGTIDAPMPPPPDIGSTPGPPVDSEFAGKRAAPRSKQTNTLDNVPSPSSSVAGAMSAALEQKRAEARKRLEKLKELRGNSLLNGRLAPGTCSFFAGPAGSTPAEAVWICDVIFSNS